MCTRVLNLVHQDRDFKASLLAQLRAQTGVDAGGRDQSGSPEGGRGQRDAASSPGTSTGAGTTAPVADTSKTRLLERISQTAATHLFGTDAGNLASISSSRGRGVAADEPTAEGDLAEQASASVAHMAAVGCQAAMEVAHAAASAKSPWDTGLAFAAEAEVMS